MYDGRRFPIFFCSLRAFFGPHRRGMQQEAYLVGPRGSYSLFLHSPIKARVRRYNLYGYKGYFICARGRNVHTGPYNVFQGLQKGPRVYSVHFVRSRQGPVYVRSVHGIFSVQCSPIVYQKDGSGNPSVQYLF